MPELNVYVQALEEAMHPLQGSLVPRHSKFFARQMSQAVRENWPVLEDEARFGKLLSSRSLDDLAAGSLQMKVVKMVKLKHSKHSTCARD